MVIGFAISVSDGWNQRSKAVTECSRCNEEQPRQEIQTSVRLCFVNERVDVEIPGSEMFPVKISRIRFR
jgi:hypothetical protein